VPESVLTVLKFCLLALVYLFLLRVLRVVYLELGGRSRARARRQQARFEATGRTATVPVPPAPAPAPSPLRERRPVANGSVRLEVLEPPEHRGTWFPVDAELTVGRAPGCHISLQGDTYVSQLHARVFVQDGAVFVEDLGSTNGTYVNRTKVDATVPLHPGDYLQIGRTVMEVMA
jgi:pSer/pThr/pTyr-binding forkhead associated (FHA) protein